MGVAWLTALDPIPGDALFYAGRPVQATINAIGGGLMGITFFALLPGVLESCTKGDTVCENWQNGVLGPGMFMVGGLYFASLLWDGIVGMHYVNEHNRKIKEKSAAIRNFQPILGMNSDGVTAGLQFQF